MSARLDAVQLDRAWDAAVSGKSLEPLPSDPDEQLLFYLLSQTSRPTPRHAFVQSLECALELPTRPAPISVRPRASIAQNPRTRKATSRWQRRAPSRWSTSSYALAAIALIVLLASIAIVRQPAVDHERAIPAVSDRFAGESLTPIAADDAGSSHTFDLSELAQLQSNDWGWIGISQETIAPGQLSHEVATTPLGKDPGYTGITMIWVEQGALTASVDAGTWVQRGSVGKSERIVHPTTLTLEMGDTLFAPPGSLAALWNTGDSDATYLTGAAYTTIFSTLASSSPNAHAAQGSAVVNGNHLALDTPLTMALAHVVVDPGDTYSYAISSETWLMAIVDGDGLQQQKEVMGVVQGSPESLPAGSYALHERGFGEYSLTNTDTDPVDVFFFRVEPATQTASGTPTTSETEVLFNQVLTPEQLQEYRLDDWRWVSFARNVIFPQGDTEAFTALHTIGSNVIPGINVMAIESGSLHVMPESAVLVARGAGGELDSSPGGVEIRLGPGDALLYLPGTEGRFWNPTESETVVIGGGGYLRPSAPVFSAVNGNRTTNRLIAGQFNQGLDVTPGAMPADGPVSISIERVSIAPSGSTTIATDPTHWSIAVVMQGDLQQFPLVDDQPSGDAVPAELGASVLQPHEAQTVQLVNAGSDDAVIYVMRIEQADSQLGEQARTASPATG
jgi:hypothetical protein